MTIEFNSDHDNPDDCQLIICITGTAQGIADAVKDMQIGYNSWPKDYKPVQDTVVGHSASRSVITPIWKGQKY